MSTRNVLGKCHGSQEKADFPNKTRRPDADGLSRGRQNKGFAAAALAIYNYAFINLKNYYYFTFIRQGKTRTNPEKVENFSAYQKDGLLVYKFYIDLSKYKGNELYLAVYDYTYFCDVRYPENPVSLKYDASKVSVNYAIEENKDFPVYYSPLAPASDTTVYYEWKPGLQTYYPKEVHLTYK